jgi:hypothetical protein
MHNSPARRDDERGLAPLDFEVTDFETARRALEEPPAGVRDVQRLSRDYWGSQRRPGVPSDRVISSPTIEWLVELPGELQPLTLAEKYPRVANAIAAIWSDCPRAIELLDALLQDRRGGRLGFPYDVEVELRALRSDLEERRFARFNKR